MGYSFTLNVPGVILTIEFCACRILERLSQCVTMKPRRIQSHQLANEVNEM